MTEANSWGTRLSFEVVTPGCGVTRWASCDPGTGTLSPSTGLWYPGGETIRHLAVERCVDSIHMYTGGKHQGSWKSAALRAVDLRMFRSLSG